MDLQNLDHKMFLKVFPPLSDLWEWNCLPIRRRNTDKQNSTILVSFYAT